MISEAGRVNISVWTNGQAASGHQKELTEPWNAVQNGTVLSRTMESPRNLYIVCGEGARWSGISRARASVMDVRFSWLVPKQGPRRGRLAALAVWNSAGRAPLL
jgi:hypothetical protein